MAVLFMMYIPFEEFESGFDEDELDQSKDGCAVEKEDLGSQDDEKFSRSDVRKNGVRLKNGPENKPTKVRKGSPSSSLRIQINSSDWKDNQTAAAAEDDRMTVGGDSDEKTLETRSLRSGITDCTTITAEDQLNGEEDKPLLPSRTLTCSSSTTDVRIAEGGGGSEQLAKNPQNASTGKLNKSKDGLSSQSTGKFKVTPAPADGLAVDVNRLAPGNGGTSRRGSRDNELADFASSNVTEQVHDVTTEILTLRQALCEILDKLCIENDVWERTDDTSQWQIKFVVDHRKCDVVLNKLTNFGFGRIADTSVSVFPASFHYSGLATVDNDKEEKQREKDEGKSEFIKSIKSRLTVAQVVGAVKSNATLTFDFLVLILLASMIAGLGLAESSSVVLVASMLISPLMGPIIGFTFGIVVKNRELWRLGVTNELIGLSVCLTYGFLFGLFTGTINNTAARWNSALSWPTAEMQARGQLRSLWVGVLIALPSGAGVALSILGGNTGSLVGVAISASLLPPAVNAGMLWGLALVSAISHPPLINDNMNDNFTLFSSVPPDCQPLLNNDYEFYYSCHMPTEAAILASVSLLLTILNIICIFIMGIAVLKIKEVAPHGAMSTATTAFWKKDLAVARGTYRTIKGRACMDMAKMAKEIVAEFKLANPDGNMTSVIQEIQKNPTLFEVPEEVPIKVPEFLHQLSHEDHELAKRRQLQQTEMLKIGGHCYHTVANGTAARKFLHSPANFRKSVLENSDFENERRPAGSVMRVRMSTPDGRGVTFQTDDSTPDHPDHHPVVEEGPNGQILIIDVNRIQRNRKFSKKERLSSRLSVDFPTTPSVGRFQVKTIEEDQPTETPSQDDEEPEFKAHQKVRGTKSAAFLSV